MLRCLIVEDDELSRELLATQLADYAVCDMAADGTEGVEKFGKALLTDRPYDVIFLDIVMPTLDGHGAARAIRKLEESHGIPVEQGVNIIILSSLGTPHDVIQAYISAQSAAHLVKPVKPEKLFKALRALALIDRP
ncbi:response regulator [Trichlorobacter ammonificans]|uniref:Response regulator receiver protein n=1 Tax=Trichlorobacter ammonificans TaxID=2916410 RepID=A0ABM9D5I2_9BACT|nr:response regulator [Trichlorobacter ammonificans]CAH2030425.1 Response regulator receiver protein [Trichlorobacter ammonificans]